MNPPGEWRSRVFGSGLHLIVDPAPQLDDARRLIAEELDLIDNGCNRFDPGSDISRLNAAGGAWTEVGPTLIACLREAVLLSRATDGLVTPTVGAALLATGYDADIDVVRSRAAVVAPAAPAPPVESIEIDAGKRRIRLRPGTILDLGATAKALAADRGAAAAAAATGASVLLSLGGDIAVAGSAPEGGWRIALADDHAADPATASEVVAIQSGGLATSTIALRRWRTADGAEAHHIIDPRTGSPAQTPLRTVSVAAASCAAANAASTAAIILGGGAIVWLESRGLPSRLVTLTGGVLTVAGWPAQVPA